MISELFGDSSAIYSLICKSNSFTEQIMNRLFLFLFLSAMSLDILSQDTVNQTDASGKKQGFWRKFNDKGEKVYEGHFRADVPYGEFRYYYPDGKQKAVSVISDNGKISRTVSYFQNGMKMAEGNYRNEKKDSLWKFYTDVDGTLISDEYYKEGKKDGDSKNYFPSKGVSEAIHWKNGIREGKWLEFYTDGNIKINGQFKNDEKDGTFRAFYDSGEIKREVDYTSGYNNKIVKTYTRNGEVTLK